MKANINNAPKAGTHIGNWKAWSKESAQGLSYSLGVEKKWSLAHNFFTKLGLDGNGKYYWNNKKYNELNARLGWGLGYQTSHLELALTPFTKNVGIVVAQMVAMHSNNTLKTLAYVLILATGLILVGKFHLLWNMANNAMIGENI